MDPYKSKSDSDRKIYTNNINTGNNVKGRIALLHNSKITVIQVTLFTIQILFSMYKTSF